ncbi:MAG TPA: DUF5714 domain-containing protein [Anaeromyxobacter sp.]|nr:DUF5714 domain-containing protein [Anaeromyxobacter sp.]
MTALPGSSAAETGCLVCGAPLVYLEASAPMACALCGASRASNARCAAGHHACDACHAATAKDVIERTCAATDETDPVALAVRLMRHPAVKMHGPEHHFLVPAVLLAAYSNARGEPERRAARVAEARRRSDPVLGSFCGIQGACGAAIGTGTFVAIATGSTPTRGPERGLSNRMTARALDVISRTAGARCCKRDSFLALLAAVRFAKERLGVDLPARGPACDWSGTNAECLGDACPFHR